MSNLDTGEAHRRESRDTRRLSTTEMRDRAGPSSRKTCTVAKAFAAPASESFKTPTAWILYHEFSGAKQERKRKSHESSQRSSYPPSTA